MLIRFGVIAIVACGSLGLPEKGESAPSLCHLRGEVLDSETGKPIEARVYIQREDGKWFFPASASPAGTAVEYHRDKGRSVEMHTTLSAHPFVVDLEPGTYTVTAERGKEYFPVTETVKLDSGTHELQLKLKRWIDMASLGWYSGDTHVHRTFADLPNILLAEDLNVAFPLSYWVWDSFEKPKKHEESFDPSVSVQVVEVDRTHVFHPLSTEYELTRVNGKPHTQGAFFILGHKTPFQIGGPPVAPIGEQARSEGALLELDKHNWPWSMMLVPVMEVDLFEITNNHLWRTEFLFKDFAEPAPEYMNIETDADGMTELGWMHYGFENYYALLNCGFRMRPTAGTASGVHPVPLGFGRVYVHLPEGFSYDAWIAGLNEGRSFVTTGPMVFAEVDGKSPGHTFVASDSSAGSYRVRGTIVSENPLTSIEVLKDGKVFRTLSPANLRGEKGQSENEFDEKVPVDSSSWIAVRCFEETPQKRVRFAHTAPVYVDVPGRPLHPREEQIQFLVDRMSEQIERNQGVLPEAALDEYRLALKKYEAIARGHECPRY